MTEGVIQPLLSGFELAFQAKYLVLSFLGALFGTFVGVIPGIGAASAVALLLPFVLNLDPVGGIIMLAACYAGVMYGGSTTSILLNVPGGAFAVAVSLDGHPMAKQGRAGPALCVSAIGGYIAGTLGLVGLMFLGPFIADFALRFGPPEYLALMAFGLTAVASLSGRSIVKGLLAMLFGLAIATVGTDLTGASRYVFDNADLLDGIEFLSVTLGLFAISEILITGHRARIAPDFKIPAYRLYITLKELLQSLGAMIRGAVIGFFVGVMPGAGATIGTMLAYSFEKQISRHPEGFGKGEIRGVAAPEAANNAVSSGSLVPMLSLGIPGSGTTAVMLTALIALDVQPGPLMFSSHPDVIWGLIAALYIGNIMLLILNLPLVGIWVALLRIPMRYVLPAVVVISVLGVFSVNQALFDILLLVGFGLVGYLMRRNGFPLAPVILGVVLGGRLEEALRQSVIMTRGEILLIFERPIVIAFFCVTLIVLSTPYALGRLRNRDRRTRAL
jgi:putative tricarboxylic transport membrane protein